MNSRRRPIPLYPNPPLSPKKTQAKPESADESSDFAPIKERKSTPDRLPPASNCCLHCSLVAQRQPEQCLSPSEDPEPSRLRQHPPNTGLGNRNRLNTIATSVSVTQAKGTDKPSSKRGPEVLEVSEERPLKKKRMTLTSKDDMDWLKHEIGDIKERIIEISEHLRGDKDHRLERLLQCVQELP